MSRILFRSSVLALALCGCSDSGPVGVVSDGGADAGRDVASDAATIPGLLTLRLDPPSVELREDGTPPFATTDFRAIGTFADGERDITVDVGWSLAPERLGSIGDGGFVGSGIGGRGVVTAAAGAVSATGSVTVFLDRVEVLPDVAATTPGLFPIDTAGDVLGDPRSPTIVYPSHETMFPLNLERLDHQWNAGADTDLFEVRYSSDFATVRFFTSSLNYVTNSEAWRWIALTHAGESATLTVRATSAEDPAQVFGSAPITLLFSESEVPGALFYWSTGSKGVMRATLSSEVATKFFTDPETRDDTCVSCHTVSRNGRRLAVGFGGERLRQVSVPERELQIPAEPEGEAREYGWGTYNPEADRLLYANKGELRLLDAENGEDLGPVALPEGMYATHPDWSPDGAFVAIAYSSERPGNKDVRGSSLARLPVLPDGTFGEPEVLVASSDDRDNTLYFPSYSPDSRWIAFVQGEGKSKDNESARLFLVAATGGTPVEVARLNERVANEDGITGVGNSMPTWAPSTSPGIFWIAFSSTRRYGNVRGQGLDQLWGVAIDPAEIGGGRDPSHAAFWLPFQEIEEGNHRAFWAVDTENVCPSEIEICDGIDNDCDGVVDLNCCTPMREICDGVDNDCDGVIDEGCGCMSVEICDNATDDDCDMAVDEDCVI